ncbi:integrase [Streptomyces sp. NPDC058464]|uniref:integrase n=1 Tax=Streptomyces sp. NPDC058464 TaxID=3346511 RepID=UPI003667DB7A
MPYVEVRGGNIRVKWWGGAYCVGSDGKATRRKKYESASGPEPGVPFEDEEEAYNYGLDREHEVRHGTHIPRASAKTLMQDYCWMWLDAQDLRDTSVGRYRSRLRARIVPYWGERPVGDITTWEYEAWKKDLQAASLKGEISHHYVDQLTSLFGLLMTDAVVKYKLRNESPVIVQRRRGRYRKKKREVKRPLRMEVLHQLATNAYHVWGFTGWAYMWTLGFTGMRPPGEMWGLRREFASPTWPASDPDREQREAMHGRYGPDAMPALRVQFQSQYEGGVRSQVSPKYDSHRTLVVPPFLHDMHAALLASHDSPWMFPALDGAQMSTQWHEAYWAPIRDGAPERTARRDYRRRQIHGVEEMQGKRIYLLRHGHREWLEEDGHSRVAMETRMGHEVAGVEGLYSNLTPSMELRITEALQERWEAFWAMGIWWAPPFPITLPDGASVGR